MARRERWDEDPAQAIGAGPAPGPQDPLGQAKFVDSMDPNETGTYYSPTINPATGLAPGGLYYGIDPATSQPNGKMWGPGGLIFDKPAGKPSMSGFFGGDALFGGMGQGGLGMRAGFGLGDLASGGLAEAMLRQLEEYRMGLIRSLAGRPWMGLRW